MFIIIDLGMHFFQKLKKNENSLFSMLLLILHLMWLFVVALVVIADVDVVILFVVTYIFVYS